MASTDVNVKVAVRCRPMNSRESQLGSQCIVQVVDNKSVIIRNPSIDETCSSSTTAPDLVSPRPSTSKDDAGGVSTAAAGCKTFTFDYAYFTDSTQAQVYDAIAKPIVDQALQGYNGTIFAYGQTGSGKTHTMMGSGDDHGIIPRMNHDLFQRLSSATTSAAENDDGSSTTTNTKFLVTVSFLEIYNEVIKDLLNPSDKLLKIREHPDMGIYVEQLAELVVKEPSDVVRLLAQGNKVRQVAATQMNERSSRSHSCFTIKISSKQTQQLSNGVEKEICMNAKINLVDLAGSERASKTGATGDRLKEGAAINKSLSALGNVITMLAEPLKKKGGGGGSHHVPYRDSKLTRLLQESLGGNSLTVMVAAISPADDNYEESLGTLQYANRAKAIKNATRKNEDINEKIIRELREEIERLRQMVRPGSAAEAPQSAPAGATGGAGGGGGGGGGGESMMQHMEETIANLERAKQASWEEKQRLTELFELERLKSLNNETKILGFMQTVKQEKMDIMKRIKSLQQQKLHVTRQLRTRKQSYAQGKATLQQHVESFQQQSAQLSAAQKHEMMALIDATKTLVVRDRDELVALKDQLTACEDKLVEEEAEVAAKSALLEEDDKLRRAIQDDEREKMKRERALFLQQALDEERKLLQSQAEDDKRRLQETLAETADKEHKLAEEVELQRNKALAFQQQLHATQLEHAQWKRDAKHKLTQMMANVTRAFQADHGELQLQYDHAVRLLRVARDDLVALGERNRELETELQRARAHPYEQAKPYTIRW